ncbi:hypothetical protein SARC_10326 [Sphaeroforma arctica JP610]|uniref:asparaginase n=1 Tax=Sphaeroforma arctica JP610 TaxID=667725 RepID=A0A0L0FKA7_9EUKA|nr:hypothetical protein SARC_10326 [Sphaeroforma arctica JP610]KNC77207.1 hypothetical protein SARC_10326 [Sphaeroforma arctica JP610]|eukprot:XP_014151109.1 hypothetical protein SARC_10326 [Sphaeroforma arctica JP610]
MSNATVHNITDEGSDITLRRRSDSVEDQSTDKGINSDEEINIPKIGSTQRKERKKVLIIYVGGVLGMEYSTDGSFFIRQGMLTNRLMNDADFMTDDMPQITVNEWVPAILSSNMSTSEWVRLAEEITDAYYDYDGFVVVHGTDTMAYTATALSFMLESLGKPIIFTGSCIPFCDVHSDARRNLIVSLDYACVDYLCEVCIFFNNTLLRANRATKHNTGSLNAFESFNYPPLGVLGVHLKLKRSLLLPTPKTRFRLHTKMDKNVLQLRLTPGFSDRLIQNALQPPCRGVVLQIYGAGQYPDKQNLWSILNSAASHGVIVVLISQCHVGYVDFANNWEFNSLKHTNLVQGGDMTSEAACTKLAYLLALGLPFFEVKKLMRTDLRGELNTDAAKDVIDSLSLHRSSFMKDDDMPSMVNKQVLYEQQVDVPEEFVLPDSVASLSLKTKLID